MRLRSWRFVVFIVPVLAAFYALSISVAYRNPPLLVEGLHQAEWTTPALGLDLFNNAAWAIRLRSISVVGGDRPARIDGVVSDEAQTAGSLAVTMPLDRLSPLPFEGLRVPPSVRGEAHPTYAVRLEW
ncbi:MAG TPA: hypothetical protein VD902_14615, partial [Symbiobacteriaceae bacterium]|nr:hypothetical protein [Symbiobacteriaceae bacterium]